LKLLIITRYFQPVHNGLAHHTQLLTKLLQQSGAVIHILCEAHSKRTPSGDTDAAPRVELWEYKNRWELMKSINRLCKREGYDAIIFQYVPHMWGRGGFAPIAAMIPLWITMRFRIPVISYMHELYYDWSKNLKELLLGVSHRIQLGWIGIASRAMIITNHKRERALHLLWRRKVHRIHAGNISGRKDLHLRRQRFDYPYITWFGTLSDDQRLTSMMEAFVGLAKNNSELRLVMVGGFDVLHQRILDMEQRVDDDTIWSRVVVKGFAEDDELSDILSGSLANLILVGSGPSGRRSVVAAYLKSGRPIIAIDGAETDPEFIHQENILLVPDLQPDALQSAIELLISDHTLRDKLERGGARLYDAAYSDQTIVSQLDRLLLSSTGKSILRGELNAMSANR
jgi:glycosyltransferase involved in cell wall biosynthesis